MKAYFLWVATVSVAVAATPDWTGFYANATAHDIEGLKSPTTGSLRWEDFGTTVYEHLQPWAKMRMETTNGEVDDTGAVCMLAGILRAPGTPFPSAFSVLPSQNKIVMPYWELNVSGVRRIYLNRQHSKDVLPTWNGDSIGHWEGDTLVVDTIGFNDKSWLSGGFGPNRIAVMAPHTEETHLTERMWQIQHNGKTLLGLTGTVEDRKALTSAYTYTFYYAKQDIEMDVHVCAEDLTFWKQWRNNALKKELQRAREVK